MKLLEGLGLQGSWSLGLRVLELRVQGFRVEGLVLLGFRV